MESEPFWEEDEDGWEGGREEREGGREGREREGGKQWMSFTNKSHLGTLKVSFAWCGVIYLLYNIYSEGGSEEREGGKQWV